MSIPKKIAGYLFFFYASFWFVITMLLIFIPVWVTTWFKDPKRSRLLHPVFRCWMNVYFPLVFCPVRRKGKEYFQKGETYVVVVNHNSFLDIPVSSPWIPGPNKTLAKIELSRIPIFGTIYKAGSILVDRKNPRSRRESFQQMHTVLEQGLHLCLYPEGTRNNTDQPLRPFYDGAFITAIRTRKPIIPALIFHTKDIYPANESKIMAWPKPIRIHFLPPVPTKGLSLDDVTTLKDEIHSQMWKYYTENSLQFK